MYCHGWTLKELSPTARAPLDQHLKSCETCRGVLATQAQVRSLMKQLPEPVVPTAGLESLLHFAEQAVQTRTATTSFWRFRWAPPAALAASLVALAVWVGGDSGPKLEGGAPKLQVAHKDLPRPPDVAVEGRKLDEEAVAPSPAPMAARAPAKEPLKEKLSAAEPSAAAGGMGLGQARPQSIGISSRGDVMNKQEGAALGALAAEAVRAPGESLAGKAKRAAPEAPSMAAAEAMVGSPPSAAMADAKQTGPSTALLLQLEASLSSSAERRETKVADDDQAMQPTAPVPTLEKLCAGWLILGQPHRAEPHCQRLSMLAPKSTVALEWRHKRIPAWPED